MIRTSRGGFIQEDGEPTADFVRKMLAERPLTPEQLAAIRRVVGPVVAESAQDRTRRPEAA